MQSNENGLSYFALHLTRYLREYFPELVDDTEFVHERANAARVAYTESLQRGADHVEANAEAAEVLFHGLHFSRHDMLLAVPEGEFAEELPSPLPAQLASYLLDHHAIRQIFGQYDLGEGFAESAMYDTLYSVLTGAILTLIEQRGVPSVKV